MSRSNDQGSGRKTTLPPHVRAALGKRLRESLEPIVNEPVPERFLRLLDELEQGGDNAFPEPRANGAADRAGSHDLN